MEDNNEEIDFNVLKGRKNPKEDKDLSLLATQKKLIIILEHANLEVTSNKKQPELINSDDHNLLIKKMQKSYEDYRPDVTHQCLLHLLDSPLNKAGLLQVFISTKENVLIEVNPKTKIPRSYKRFCGLMAQLLTKLRIRAANSSEILLKVIKNPITDHLPLGCPIIATNEKSKLVNLDEYVESLNKGVSIAFVIGAMSKGDLNIDYNNDTVSICSYPLTAGIVCSKICTSFEKAWDVL